MIPPIQLDEPFLSIYWLLLPFCNNAKNAHRNSHSNFLTNVTPKKLYADSSVNTI